MELITEKLFEYGVLGIMVIGISIALVYVSKLLMQSWQDRGNDQDSHRLERIDDRKEFVMALREVGEKITTSSKETTKAMNDGFQRVVDTIINNKHA